MNVAQIEPAELIAAMGREPWTLLDVRETWERDIAAVEPAVHIPLGELPVRLGELPKSKPVAVLCHSGMRSDRAAQFLAMSGFDRVANIVGGIDRWAVDVDPGIARY